MGRLLIIDDDDAMRRLLRLNLAGSHEIIDTGDPEEALALALQHKPDAILLDLRMPKFSGFELCQTFTSFSSTQLIPVFVVSGEAGARTKQICRDLGAAEYFEKPVDFERLRVSLEKVLRGKRPERRIELIFRRLPGRAKRRSRGAGLPRERGGATCRQRACGAVGGCRHRVSEICFSIRGKSGRLGLAVIPHFLALLGSYPAFLPVSAERIARN